MITNKTRKGRLAEKCHMCKSASLTRILDLGHQPHSDHFPTKEQLNEHEERYPLRFVSCKECGLLQIDYLVNPKILYQTDYLYQSAATTKTGSAHFKDMAHDICRAHNIPKDALAIDIGSNVGALLHCFKNEGLRVLGVDPADVAKQAIENGIETILDFFGSHIAVDIEKQYGKAHVITGTNVFAHLHDLDDAVEGMKKLLADDGVISVEAPYVVDLIEQLQYDTIYHQHIGYLSVKPMSAYFRRFGLELFGLKKSNYFGGSMRYYIGHEGWHTVSNDIERYIKEEESHGLYSQEKLSEFANKVSKQKMDLIKILTELKGQGKNIVGISAPAKGNTLLNYCHIDRTILDFTTEKNPLKIGRFTPGTHIPIYDDDRLLAEQPDYALILAWNFAPEIMNNLSEFKKQGGKFIIPIPSPKII